MSLATLSDLHTHARPLLHTHCPACPTTHRCTDYVAELRTFTSIDERHYLCVASVNTGGCVPRPGAGHGGETLAGSGVSDCLGSTPQFAGCHIQPGSFAAAPQSPGSQTPSQKPPLRLALQHLTLPVTPRRTCHHQPAALDGCWRGAFAALDLVRATVCSENDLETGHEPTWRRGY